MAVRAQVLRALWSDGHRKDIDDALWLLWFGESIVHYSVKSYIPFHPRIRSQPANHIPKSSSDLLRRSKFVNLLVHWLATTESARLKMPLITIQRKAFGTEMGTKSRKL